MFVIYVQCPFLYDLSSIQFGRQGSPSPSPPPRPFHQLSGDFQKIVRYLLEKSFSHARKMALNKLPLCIRRVIRGVGGGNGWGMREGRLPEHGKKNCGYALIRWRNFFLLELYLPAVCLGGLRCYSPPPIPLIADSLADPFCLIDSDPDDLIRTTDSVPCIRTRLFRSYRTSPPPPAVILICGGPRQCFIQAC